VRLFAHTPLWRYSHIDRCVNILTQIKEDLAQANAYDRFYLNGLESGRSTLYVTRLLRTLKSLGITLSVTFDADVAAGGERRSDG
jgi:hypothetical protein